MNTLPHLIDVTPDTPIERDLIRELQMNAIPFEAQVNLLDGSVSIRVLKPDDLPAARKVLYEVLHPNGRGKRK